jgi:uncharacterized membrane protein
VKRREYIDWLRGIAVVSMIEWHVIDAWSLREGRDGAVWTLIRMIGGLAAPLFLFLAGVAVPMAIAAYERRGRSHAQAAWDVQKRGWQVFLIAHLFRVQSFLLNPNGKWWSLFKPDILNILGLGLVGTSFLTGRATSRSRRIWFLLVPALAILALTPFSRGWWWPTLLPPRLEAYIRPVGNFGVFTLFPWVAYVPIGAFIGSLIAEAKSEQDEVRLLKALAVAGAIFVIPGTAASWIGPVAKAWSWVGHSIVVLNTSAYMMLGLAASWWLVKHQPQRAVAPLLLLGRTSLFVYWVHVEIAYGVVSYPLHSALTLPWSIFGFVAVLGVMCLAAGWWASRPGGPWIPDRLRAADPLGHHS